MNDTPVVAPGATGDAEAGPASGMSSSTRRFTVTTIGWLLAYAVIRVVLAITDPSIELSAIGEDLVLLSGWPCVAVLLVAAVVIGLQSTVVPAAAESVLVRRSLAVAGAVLAAALMTAAALVLLDLVGGLLPGLGIVFYPYGTLIRLGAVLAAGLIAVHTRQFWARTRPAGHPRRRSVLWDVPWWARAAGYLAAVGCLARLGAQAVAGFTKTPLSAGPSAYIFEVGFLLAGLLLPMALVHRWGRIWPSWVPGLAGRHVPRWLLIGPGGVLGVGLTAYFGMGFGQLLAERLQGRDPFPPSGDSANLPEAFFWVSIPAYLLWGIGLLVATAVYFRITQSERRP